ncbi:MAG: DUF2937 family protein [Nevskiales bacterium]
MFRDYLRLITFTGGLLVGVQLPSFVDQYEKRVDAHYVEAQLNFAGFQATADRYFGGDVEAMLRHHDQSSDLVFQDEAKAIRSIWQRLQMLKAEQAAMNQDFVRQVYHLLANANTELRNETRSAYSYTVLLTMEAIASGIAGGFVTAFSVELVVLFLGVLFLPGPRARRV